MGFTIDTSEVRALAVDLTAASLRVAVEAPKAIFKGAMAIKAQLREELGASGYFGGGAPMVSFDILYGGLAAEVGPEPRGAALLENIAYFGGAHGGGGTVPDPQGALDAEAPNLERALSDLAAKALGG